MAHRGMWVRRPAGESVHLPGLPSGTELEELEGALCAEVGPWLELWFPEPGESPEPAKAICRRCPVRTECLDQALRNGKQHGVWGGLSENERKVLRRQRRNQQQQPEAA